MIHSAMDNSSLPTTISRSVHKVWTQAQLLIAFHRDSYQKQRDEPYLWYPKNGRAGLKSDATDQEAFVNVQGKDRADDLQLKLRADRIIARRTKGKGWSGVEMTDHEVRVLIDGVWIEVAADGTVTRRAEDSVTYLEGDGGIIKVSEGAEIAVTADGTELTRRTEHRIEALTPDGVVSRARRSKPEKR